MSHCINDTKIIVDTMTDFEFGRSYKTHWRGLFMLSIGEFLNEQFERWKSYDPSHTLDYLVEQTDRSKTSLYRIFGGEVNEPSLETCMRLIQVLSYGDFSLQVSFYETYFPDMKSLISRLKEYYPAVPGFEYVLDNATRWKAYSASDDGGATAMDLQNICGDDGILVGNELVTKGFLEMKAGKYLRNSDENFSVSLNHALQQIRLASHAFNQSNLAQKQATFRYAGFKVDQKTYDQALKNDQEHDQKQKKLLTNPGNRGSVVMFTGSLTNKLGETE